MRVAQGASLFAAVILLACHPTDEARDLQLQKSGIERAEPASVVIVVVDDWAQSDLVASRADGNVWNDLLAVDSLCARGQVWDNFYAQPVCNPTRMTLMFGQYRGGRSEYDCAEPSSTTARPAFTLAGALQAAGYATAAFGKWHIGPHPDPDAAWTDAPAAYGFVSWRAWNANNLDGHCGSRNYFNWHRVDDGVGFQSTEYHTEAVALAFIDWWQRTRGPRFAYVCFQAAHPLYHVPPSYLLPNGFPTPVTTREKYEAMLVAFDTMLATMLSAVDLSNTYFIVLGDNGTPPTAIRDDQVRTRVKTTTFEDGVNVPFIIAGPRVRPGETHALGHVVDLSATIAELAHARLSAGAAPDSVSLVPVLEDGARRVREHVICDNLNESSVTRDTCVVLESENGLVKGRLFQDGMEMTSTEAFFDLCTDPRETMPLSAGDPVFADDIERIDRLLKAYLAR